MDEDETDSQHLISAVAGARRAAAARCRAFFTFDPPRPAKSSTSSTMCRSPLRHPTTRCLHQAAARQGQRFGPDDRPDARTSGGNAARLRSPTSRWTTPMRASPATTRCSQQLDGVLDADRRDHPALQGLHSRTDELEPGDRHQGQRASGGGGRMTEQEVVRKMMQKGGAKPSATEYMLAAGHLRRARQRAGHDRPPQERSRSDASRFNGCDSTRQFAKGLIDVTVRDLGRVLAPELPAEWADSIKKTQCGCGDRCPADRPRPRIHRHLQRPRSVGRPYRPRWC